MNKLPSRTSKAVRTLLSAFAVFMSVCVLCFTAGAQDRSPGTAPGTTIATSTGTTRVAGGLILHVRVTEPLSSKTSTEGDAWTGVIATESITSGHLMIPSGTQVTGIVSQSQSADQTHLPGKLAIRLTSLRGIGISSDEVVRTGTNPALSNGSLAAAGIPGEAPSTGAAQGDAATGPVRNHEVPTDAKIAAGTILTFVTQ